MSVSLSVCLSVCLSVYLSANGGIVWLACQIERAIKASKAEEKKKSALTEAESLALKGTSVCGTSVCQ